MVLIFVILKLIIRELKGLFISDNVTLNMLSILLLVVFLFRDLLKMNTTSTGKRVLINENI